MLERTPSVTKGDSFLLPVLFTLTLGGCDKQILDLDASLRKWSETGTIAEANASHLTANSAGPFWRESRNGQDTIEGCDGVTEEACKDTQKTVAAFDTGSEFHMSADDHHLLWTVTSPSGGTTLSRLSLTGEGEAEVIIDSDRVQQLNSTDDFTDREDLLGPILALAQDEDHAYWLDSANRLMRCAIGDCQTPDAIDTTGWTVYEEWLLIRGDRVYFEGRQGGKAPGVYQVRKDGSEKPELLLSRDRVSSFDRMSTADDDYFYWFEVVEASGTRYSLLRCPLADCSDTPELLVDDLYGPDAPLVAGEWLVWREVVSGTGDTHARGCPIDNCASGVIYLTDVNTWSMAADQYAFYFTSPTPGGSWVDDSGGFVNVMRYMW